MDKRYNSKNLHGYLGWAFFSFQGIFGSFFTYPVELSFLLCSFAIPL